MGSNKYAGANDWKRAIDYVWENCEDMQTDVRYSAEFVDSRAHVLTSALAATPRVPMEVAVYALNKVAVRLFAVWLLFFCFSLVVVVVIVVVVVVVAAAAAVVVVVVVVVVV